MRAFIFSLDAFVAFTLALFAVYTLIFFSSIPSSYEYVLTQAHYLSKDALFAASSSDCTMLSGPFYQCGDKAGSALDNMVFVDPMYASYQRTEIFNTIGQSIPKQFGYSFEVSSDGGNSFAAVYDTTDAGLRDPTDNHATSKRKLSVSSQVVVFDYSGRLYKVKSSPYLYTSCMGAGGSGQEVLLTCSMAPTSTNYLTGGNSIVPSTSIRIVRLTVFI